MSSSSDPWSFQSQNKLKTSKNIQKLTWAPENRPLEKEIPIFKPSFLRVMVVFGCINVRQEKRAFLGFLSMSEDLKLVAVLLSIDHHCLLLKILSSCHVIKYILLFQ